jgi:hypothetical protein
MSQNIGISWLKDKILEEGRKLRLKMLIAEMKLPVNI